MNVLIIGGAGDSPDANSVCVHNISIELLNRGHNVWILAMGDDRVVESVQYDGATLCSLPKDYYKRLTDRVSRSSSCLYVIWFKVISAFRHFLLLFTFPVTSPRRSRKVAKKAISLVDNNNIALVVSVFNPFDNIFAGFKIKKRFGAKVKVVSYHLDLRTASINSSSLVRDYIRKHALSSLVKESEVVDRMMIPFSGQKECEQVNDVRRDKIVFVGFPVYKINDSVHEFELPFDQSAINICYIGSLSRENRDPGYVLSILSMVQTKVNKRLIVHFWGDLGGLEAEIATVPIARYHGIIDNKYTRFIMDGSDYLLNIGNAIAYDMLPSKVFGMFSTGKPIINVIRHPEDVTIPFFERYNHSIDIKEFNHDIMDVERLASSFISKDMLGRRNVDGLFDDFMPETICDIILNC